MSSKARPIRNVGKRGKKRLDGEPVPKTAVQRVAGPKSVYRRATLPACRYLGVPKRVGEREDPCNALQEKKKVRRVRLLGHNARAENRLPNAKRAADFFERKREKEKTRGVVKERDAS